MKATLLISFRNMPPSEAIESGKATETVGNHAADASFLTFFF